MGRRKLALANKRVHSMRSTKRPLGGAVRLARASRVPTSVSRDIAPEGQIESRVRGGARSSHSFGEGAGFEALEVRPPGGTGCSPAENRGYP